MDFQVFDVHVAPQVSPSGREVAGSCEDTIRGGGTLGDHVNLRHGSSLIHKPCRLMFVPYSEGGTTGRVRA